MYIDESVIAGLLAVASSIVVGGGVLYYMIHDIKMKTQAKQKS